MTTELLVAVAVVVAIFGVFALVHLLVRMEQRATRRAQAEGIKLAEEFRQYFEDTLPAGGYTDEAAQQAAAAMPFPETEAEKAQVVVAGVTAAGEPWKHGAVLPFAGPEAEAEPFPEQGPEAQAHGFPEDGPHMAAPLVGPEADAQPFPEGPTPEQTAALQALSDFDQAAEAMPFAMDAEDVVGSTDASSVVAQVVPFPSPGINSPENVAARRAEGTPTDPWVETLLSGDFTKLETLAAEAMPFVQEDGGVVVLVLDSRLIDDPEDGQMSSDPTNVQAEDDCGPAEEVNLTEAQMKLVELEQKVRVLEANLAEMRFEKTGAYEERNRVVAALATCYPSTRYKTDIDGWNEAWHNCVYIELPTGQVSWHYHDRDAKLFKHVPAKKTKWDGHSTSEKYLRLFKFTRNYEPRK